jgi:phage shock protein B
MLFVAIIVIVPVWLSLHYRARHSVSRFGGDLTRKLDELTDLAGRMQSRIETLERLLEAGPSKGKSES